MKRLKKEHVQVKHYMYLYMLRAEWISSRSTHEWKSRVHRSQQKFALNFWTKDSAWTQQTTQVKFFTTYYTLHTSGPHTHKHALLYSTCPAHTSLLSPAHSFSPPVQQIQLHLRIFMPNLMHGFPKPIPCRMHNVLCWLPNLQIFICTRHRRWKKLQLMVKYTKNLYCIYFWKLIHVLF